MSFDLTVNFTVVSHLANLLSEASYQAISAFDSVILPMVDLQEIP